MPGSNKTPSQYESENSQPKVIALADIPSIEFTVGDEAANVINVALQVVDADRVALALQLAFIAWLSDTEAAVMTGTTPSVGTSIGTEGVIFHEYAPEILFELLTNADGLLDLNIEEVGTYTWWLNVRLPGGEVVSTEVVFA
jgi:hypothetical protein